MQNGICPNCHAQSVFMRENGVEIGSTDGIYVVSNKQRRMSPIISYVCTCTCGYMQQYLIDQEVLAEIATAGHWKHINP